MNKTIPTNLKLRAIILDDEAIIAENLSLTLAECCPDVIVLKICNDPVLAVRDIQELKPDLLFLDIMMPNLDGFQLLEKYFPEPDFLVVFTTAYEEHMLRAIRLSALDYLLKPIRSEDLCKAVDRAINRLRKGESHEGAIQEMLSQRTGPLKIIRLRDINGYDMKFTLEDIIRFKAEEGYVRLFWFNRGKVESVLVEGDLTGLEEILEGAVFFRAHRSDLINLKQVNGYHSSESTVRMSNGDVIGIARRRKEEFEFVWKGITD